MRFCVLLAIGWTRGESYEDDSLRIRAPLDFWAASVGVAIGAVGVKVLSERRRLKGLLQPDLSIALLGLSVVIAVAVGISSGLYPPGVARGLMPSLALQSRMRHVNL